MKGCNTSLNLAKMWERMKSTQLQSMRSEKAAATWAKVPEVIEEEEEEEPPKKARVILPLRRTFTYGTDRIRHTLEDEECNDYKLTTRGSGFKTLPSQSLHKWI